MPKGGVCATIAHYLEVSRPTVYAILKRWVEEGVQGRGSRNPMRIPVKPASICRLASLFREVRKRRIRYSGSGECSLPSSNEALPLLHEPGSRIMAVNRLLYGIKPKPQGSHQPKPQPFKATSRHERWCLDIRYIEKHRIPEDLAAPFMASRSWMPSHEPFSKVDIFQSQDASLCAHWPLCGCGAMWCARVASSQIMVECFGRSNCLPFARHWRSRRNISIRERRGKIRLRPIST